MRTGAIVLCGGKSDRMGRDKASLPFGGELMLPRVVRLVGEAVDLENVVVVAAPKQPLPELSDGVPVVRDEHEYRGPLQGLSTGLRVLSGRVDAVYATGCDVPLLVPAFVRRMFELLGDYDAAVPVDGLHFHALAAAYRPRVTGQIERLLAAGRMSARSLVDEASTRKIPADELRLVDPQLLTLMNLNTPQDYAAALAVAGF